MNAPTQNNAMDVGTAIIAAIAASAIGALFYNVLPVYLGTAQDYRGLDNRAIGFLSSAFFLGFNVVTASAFFWIRRISWRVILLAATPLSVFGLLLGTLSTSYWTLLVSVSIAGAALAAIYGVGTTALGDTSNPGRWYGYKIAAEAAVGAVLLLVLPVTVIAKWGFDGTIYGMVVALALLTPLLLWMPAGGVKGTGLASSGLDTNAKTAHGIHAQSPYIWGTLLATLFFFSGASVVWAFVERIGVSGGHDAATISVLLSITLVFAVIGSIVAAVAGGRLRNSSLFFIGVAVFALSVGLLMSPEQFALYAVGGCLFAGAFGYMVPVIVTEIAELDIDGRYVVLSVPAMGLGGMAGPAIGGILAQSGNFTTLLIFSFAAAFAASLLMAYAAVRARAPQK